MAEPFDRSFKGWCLGIWCLLWSILFLLGISCALLYWPHYFGWHSPLDWILPTKVQGLYGVKLDEPIVDDTATREGNHFNISCDAKPCKSIRAEVVDISGKPHVVSIHVESYLQLGKVLCFLNEKYDRDPEETDDPDVAHGAKRKEGTSRKVSDILAGFSFGIHSKYYIFRDWRSCNFITVEVLSPRESDDPVLWPHTQSVSLKSTSNDSFAPSTSASMFEQQPRNSMFLSVILHAYGKLYLRKLEEAEENADTEWKRQRDAL